MKKVFFISILISIFLFSCTLESEFGLTDKQIVDKKLFGIWVVNDGSEKLVIQSNANHTLTVKVFDENNKKEILSKNAYIANINGYNIINLKSIKDKKTVNAFYSYRISNGKLYYRGVNDKLIDKNFTSSQDLETYFNNNIDRKNFFNEWSDGMVKSK